MNHTAGSLDIADPSDWLTSAVPKLAPVESALRCQVCKDFFDTPMITSCSHTFCSLCIRRCLTNDGKCPACRASDQELRLRRNWAVQEIVDTFKVARPSLTSLAARQADQSKARRPRAKRKVDDTDFEDDDSERKMVVGRRKTRSQSQQQMQSPVSANSQTPKYGVQLERDVTDIGKLSEIPIRVIHAEAYADDGLAACPICAQRMKEEAVFLHLDTHNEASEAERSEPARHRRSSSIEIVGRPQPKTKSPERLPQINYSLMKDNALRKKLSDLGIPNTGPRALLIRRHAEWVNIVNANADSSRPKSKREMLRELDIWDRSTGRSIATGGTDSSNPGSIMSRDFDGAAWSVNHKVDFQDLISKAKHTGTVSNSSERKRSTDHISLQREEKVELPHISVGYATITSSTLDKEITTVSSDPDATVEKPSVI
ncbi:MAG: hypothetical protein Q9225_000161 [Loekoesia sp. 1 TL-2023]